MTRMWVKLISMPDISNCFTYHSSCGFLATCLNVYKKSNQICHMNLNLPPFAILLLILLICLYTGLPYYTGVPGVPSAFQYGPTVFVPPGSAKQPAMGLANPSNQYHQQHQPNYGQHAYGTGKTQTNGTQTIFKQ